MKFKDYLNEISPGMGYNVMTNPACHTCKYFSDMKCTIAKKVIEKHGEDKLKVWVKNHSEHNKCSFYENKSKQ